MWKAMAAASLALACLALPAHGQTPERTVSGTTVTSTHDPKLRIDLPASAHYVGADRWLLLGAFLIVSDLSLGVIMEYPSSSRHGLPLSGCGTINDNHLF